MTKIRPDRYLGGNIQKARLQKGFTQEQMVAKLQVLGVDISRSSYAKIETGWMNVRVSELIALSMILEVDYNYFFEGLHL